MKTFGLSTAIAGQSPPDSCWRDPPQVWRPKVGPKPSTESSIMFMRGDRQRVVNLFHWPLRLNLRHLEMRGQTRRHELSDLFFLLVPFQQDVAETPTTARLAR